MYSCITNVNHFLFDDENVFSDFANSLEEIPASNSNQEEAETKVILHAVQRLNCDLDKYTFTRANVYHST